MSWPKLLYKFKRNKDILCKCINPKSYLLILLEKIKFTFLSPPRGSLTPHNLKLTFLNYFQLCVCMCMWVKGSRRPGTSDPLELGGQAVVSPQTWILGSKLRSFGGTEWALSQRSISPDTVPCLRWVPPAKPFTLAISFDFFFPCSCKRSHHKDRIIVITPMPVTLVGNCCSEEWCAA